MKSKLQEAADNINHDHIKLQYLPYCLISLVSVASNGLSILGTSFKFECKQSNWFFDYNIPKNVTSFYYALNINSTILTCNNYGWVSFLGRKLIGIVFSWSISV